MENYDAGSPIAIEVTIYEYTPFGAEALDDPTSVKVTVTDPKGTVKVTAADMTKHQVGKYFYICQTLAAWEKGKYQVKIETTDTYNDTTILRSAFGLI